jgi:ribonuclease HI
MRLYTPPERWDDKHDLNTVETYNPAHPFVLGPCQLCGVADCGKDQDGHGSPIIIAISGVKRSGFTAACGIFCNINSPYNKALLLHRTRLTAEQAELHAAITALKQVKAFLATEVSEEANKQATRIVIKTDLTYLTGNKAARARCTNHVQLAREFNELLVGLDETLGQKPSVEFWKVSRERNLMANQLANTILDGWEETRSEMRTLFDGVV